MTDPRPWRQGVGGLLRGGLGITLLILVGPAGAAEPAGVAAPAVPGSRPNLVVILADDLGWGDLGCYGQQRIRTPELDQLARDGVRFTSAYCGVSVCAPSRCALLTGLDMGHAPIRANREVRPEGQMPLPDEVPTLAELLRAAGYRSGIFGKWGLGAPGVGGLPNQRGFDQFFGFICQRHAHGYYPEFLWRNTERVVVPGNLGGYRRDYAPDVIFAEALQWLKSVAGEPFFLYLAATIPHARFEVPDQGPYATQDWPEPERNYAAMITRLDEQVGRLRERLVELGIAEKTLVIFTSDNGAADDLQGHRLEFFDSNGPYRGAKRSLYEGGLRVPALAAWPGTIVPGQVRDEPWAFWDLVPTALELAALEPPPAVELNGKSLVPLLTGQPPAERACFYWEIHEGTPKQAVRFDTWKAVRNRPHGPLELYDLNTDPNEKHDLAARQPDRLAEAERLLGSSRRDVPGFTWPSDE